MVTTETHQSQDLLVPLKNPEQPELASPSFPSTDMDPDKLSQGPVNAITVLTLLDKLVNMLDTVQENQHKMETHQVEMEDVVRGIQADITKLSKNHSHTSNTVSKLLDKSRKMSVTMKEVREKMERQAVQVKRLEANHAHLISRNHFKVLIFQEEKEIPSSVFVKDPPPFPRDEILEEGEEPAPGTATNQEDGLQTIELSSDEDVGLEADQEEEDFWSHDLENMEKSRAEKLKRSSLKKVDSLKRAFTRENIEKKMNKIKQRTSALKVSPQMFSIRKPRSSSDSQPPEASPHTEEVLTTEAQVQPPSSSEMEVPFTQVHAQLAPAEQEEEEKQEEKQEEKKKKQEEEEKGSVKAEADESVVSEEVGGAYALSSTLPQEEEGTGEPQAFRSATD